MPKDAKEHAFEITNAIIAYINISQDLFRTDCTLAMAEAKQKLLKSWKQH